MVTSDQRAKGLGASDASDGSQTVCQVATNKAKRIHPVAHVQSRAERELLPFHTLIQAQNILGF